MAEDMAKRIAQYIQLRDKLKFLDEEHDKKRKPLQELMDILSGILQKFMGDNNLENLKTEAGTCYVSTRYTASLADAHAFMEYVIATKKFDLLERRANATAVRDHVQTEGSLPAGCNLTALQSVGVRRRPGT